MPSDELNDELSSVFWPSPSPEDEVRRRAWQRGRRLRAQRLVPAAAALALVLAAVVPMAVRDRDQASSLRTADDGHHSVEDVEPGQAAGPSYGTQGHQEPPVPFNGVEVPIPGSDDKAYVLPPYSPPPRGRANPGPLFEDAEGDARYKEEGFQCGSHCEDSFAYGEPVPALDLRNGDLVCAADVFRVVVGVDDLAEPLPADRFGSKAEAAWYSVGIDHHQGRLEFTVTRNLRDGVVSVTGSASRRPEVGVVGTMSGIDGVRARVDEGAGRIVIESSFSAVAAAERAGGAAGGDGFRSGVIVSGFQASAAVRFEPRNNVQFATTADYAARAPGSHYMCD